MKQGKYWGATELVTHNSAFEFHAIEIKAGGFCSEHKHETKSNGFYVVSGRLLIRVWTSHAEKPDETVLTAGQYMEVKPGLFHQFEALEDVSALELYWAAYNPDDIERRTVGGVR